MARQPLPEHGACFVCGSENPRGMGLTMFREEDGRVTAEFVLSEAHQGPPGHAHGGALAAILDELMGSAAWLSGKAVLAAKIEVSFRAPAPLGARLWAEARAERVQGRKVYVASAIRLSDGRVSAEANGLFIEKREFYGERRTRGG